MYFFFHLLTGIILGLLIGDILRDERWTIPCAIGAVLPDLIDKPLGLLLFGDSIGSGRVFMHTLLAALVLLIAGLVIWQWKKNPVVPGVAVGVISHQALDLMWRTPKVWLYPLYGPFHGKETADFFFVLALSELKNPAEIVLAFLGGAGVLLFVYRDRIRRTFSRHKRAWRGLFGAAALLLCGLGGFLFWEGLKKQKLFWTGWTRPEEYFIGGIVMLLAGYMVWRWRRLVLESDRRYHA
jgi:membrane-bound metal-dependent hydrolase YbcI (DUF457 family)